MRLHSRIGTFRQLEIVLQVYEQGSISKAAETLHLTQPSVSMQLKKLADSIDTQIYNQVGKKLLFTEAGEKLVEAARDIFLRTQHLDMELSELRGLKAGTLKISVVTTSKYFIPHLLGPFCRRYPTIDVEFNIGNRQSIIERLNRGDEDFYMFSNLPDRNDIVAMEFLDNPLVAIAPLNHPLCSASSIDLADFVSQPFLMREQGSGTRYAIEEFFKKNKVSANVKMTIESNEAIKHSVMSGLGVSILSKHTLAYGESHGIKELSVHQLPIKSQWFLVTLKGKALSPIAKTFLDFSDSEGRELINHELKI